MKSMFPWNISLVNCSRVFFELLWCFLEASHPVYWMLRTWQWALDEWFPISLVKSQMISAHTPTLAYLIWACGVVSTLSICSMKHVVLVCRDRHGLIWPMIGTMQKWFTIFDSLEIEGMYVGVQLARKGYVSSRLRFHTFETRPQ